MPDQAVEVTYDPNADPPFTFVPDTVTMTASGKVVLLRRPADAPWVFTGGYVKANEQQQSLAQFRVVVEGEGRLLHIHDDFPSDGPKTYHQYAVMVALNGKPRSSPDPVIVNDPGGGG